MVTTIIKIGDSAGLILDQALLELVHLNVGDQVDASVDSTTGMLRIAPVQRFVTPKEAAAFTEEIIRKNSDLFRRLA